MGYDVLKTYVNNFLVESVQNCCMKLTQYSGGKIGGK